MKIKREYEKDELVDIYDQDDEFESSILTVYFSGIPTDTNNNKDFEVVINEVLDMIDARPQYDIIATGYRSVYLCSSLDSKNEICYNYHLILEEGTNNIYICRGKLFKIRDISYSNMYMIKNGSAAMMKIVSYLFNKNFITEQPVFNYDGHKKLWNHLAYNPGTDKPQVVYKLNLPVVIYDCYACEYASKISIHRSYKSHNKCRYCPLDVSDIIIDNQLKKVVDYVVNDIYGNPCLNGLFDAWVFLSRWINEHKRHPNTLETVLREYTLIFPDDEFDIYKVKMMCSECARIIADLKVKKNVVY